MKIAPGGAAPPSPPYERGVLSCWTTEREKLQRRESNPLLSGYGPDGSPLAFAAIKLIHPPDLHRPSVRYRRTAALSLLGWNGSWTCPRVTLPSHRFCRPSGSLAPSGTKT